MKELDLLPLQERRKIIRLSLLFKVVNGQVPAINPDDYIQLDTSRRRRVKPTALKDYVTLKSADKSARKNSRCLKLQIGRTEQFNNGYFPRSIIDWNNLSDDSTLATSVEAFKSSLQRRD